MPLRFAMVFVLGAVAAFLQEPQGPATFRASVARVAVDVNVVDDNGRPVSDLTVDDFILTVDGQPRRVLSAQFIPVQPQLEAREEAAFVVNEARERTRTAVIALQSILRRLASSDAPKTIVFISQGLVIDRDAARLSWFAPLAAAAHVTLYAVHLDPSEFESV